MLYVYAQCVMGWYAQYNIESRVEFIMAWSIEDR